LVMRQLSKTSKKGQYLSERRVTRTLVLGTGADQHADPGDALPGQPARDPAGQEPMILS
jgi:hypothetical protein